MAKLVNLASSTIMDNHFSRCSKREKFTIGFGFLFSAGDVANNTHHRSITFLFGWDGLPSTRNINFLLSESLRANELHLSAPPHSEQLMHVCIR
jgi:hypothetical protein